MNKKGIFFTLVILLLLYLIATIYMYFSRDARFTINFTFDGLLVFVLAIITSIIGIFKGNKLGYCLTILILIGIYIGINNYLFMGSLEKYLYTKNQELYNQATTMIIHKGLHGYIDLKGKYKKLSRNFTQVFKYEGFIEIQYGINSSMWAPGILVYTNDMKALLHNEKKYCSRYEVINKNWCIIYYIVD